MAAVSQRDRQTDGRTVERVRAAGTGGRAALYLQGGIKSEE